VYTRAAVFSQHLFDPLDGCSPLPVHTLDPDEDVMFPSRDVKKDIDLARGITNQSRGDNRCTSRRHLQLD
jgi:hypothetical protein